MPQLNALGYRHATLGLEECLGVQMASFGFRVYLNLPKPIFLWVRIINPSMEFIGTLQKSRFW